VKLEAKIEVLEKENKELKDKLEWYGQLLFKKL